MDKIFPRNGFTRTRLQFPYWLTHRERKSLHFEGQHFFSQTVSSILILGQIFGVLPVIGVRSRSVSQLRFKWFTFRTFQSLFVICTLLFYTVLLIWKSFSIPTAFSSKAFTLYYVSSVCAVLGFLKLAPKWPSLMRYWANVESNLPTFSDKKHRRNAMFRIRFLAFGVLAMAIIEYSLSIVSLVYIVDSQTKKDPIIKLLNVQSSHILSYSYSILVLACAKLIRITATFICTYLDIFIMMVSMGLYTQFKLYNTELKQVIGEHKPVEFWILRRIQYGRLRDLVTTVDEHIAHLNLLSFSNLIFFTCKQLFLSMRPFSTFYRTFYYWFSLISLILRAFAVSFAAACVHDESQEALKVLNALPPHSRNVETKRFFDEINSFTVALSGMKLFFLTRKLILSIAGTIVTYELLLIQFQPTRSTK